MENHRVLTEMESLFLALADKTRLRMLNLMREEEICVFLFTEILNESQPKISRHLAYLRNAGVVETRREGKLIYYRIADLENTQASSILSNTLSCLENQPEMQSEYIKLLDYYGKNIPTGNINGEFKTDIYAKSNIYSKKEELEIFLL